MPNLNLSIRTLLACVAWFAVAIVAVRSATIWWASISFSLALAILGASLISLILADKNSRAFRLGFCLAGCGYFALLFAPYLDRQIGHRLITTKLFAMLHPLLHEKRPTDAWHGTTSSELALSNRHYDLILRSANGPAPFAAPQWDPFQQTCHSLITLPIAILGGIFAACLQKPPDAT